ncbi:MAG: hypothetical protein AAE983_08075 [Thermoplasmataceae archaeon]
MKLTGWLATIVILDAADIALGGFILRYVSLVPISLTVLTYLAVVILLIDFYFITKGRRIAINAGVLLSLIAMAISTNPAHIHALEEFGSTLPLTGADITMLIGFYFLPALYIVYWLVRVRGAGYSHKATQT